MANDPIQPPLNAPRWFLWTNAAWLAMPALLIQVLPVFGVAEDSPNVRHLMHAGSGIMAFIATMLALRQPSTRMLPNSTDLPRLSRLAHIFDNPKETK